MTIGTAFLAAWLQLHGYGSPQRAAVAHHAFVESGMRTNAVSRDGHHYGLWQWAGSRRAALFRYAFERRRPWSDPLIQIEFMDREARSLPGMRAFFAATTAREAITVFCRKFERRRKC